MLGSLLQLQNESVCWECETEAGTDIAGMEVSPPEDDDKLSVSASSELHGSAVPS